MMKKIISLIKEKFFNKRFLTFGIIGLSNTLLAQGLYMLFVVLGVQVSLASILGDVLSMASSYILNMRFTYHKKMSVKSALAFPVSYIPGTIINAIAVWVVADILHAPKIWAKAISIPIVVPINFLCMNVIVKKFSSGKEEKESTEVNESN